MTPPSIAAVIRDTLAGRADIRVAILFGSQARGAARPDSDVDIAVDAPGVDVLSLGAAPCSKHRRPYLPGGIPRAHCVYARRADASRSAGVG